MVSTDEPTIADLMRRLAIAEKQESPQLLGFGKVVADMRHAQRESERTGTFHNRQAMRRHEAKVDKELEEIFGAQKSLF